MDVTSLYARRADVSFDSVNEVKVSLMSKKHDGGAGVVKTAALLNASADRMIERWFGKVKKEDKKKGNTNDEQ